MAFMQPFPCPPPRSMRVGTIVLRLGSGVVCKRHLRILAVLELKEIGPKEPAVLPPKEVEELMTHPVRGW